VPQDRNCKHLAVATSQARVSDVKSHGIIDRYRDRLSKVIIEPDEGIYFALNKGFAHSTGEIMGWVGSSDILFPDGLSIVDEIFTKFPEVE